MHTRPHARMSSYGNDTKVWQALIDTMAALATEDTLLIIANVNRFARTSAKGEKFFYDMLFGGPHFELVRTIPSWELGAEHRDRGVFIHLARPKQAGCEMKEKKRKKERRLGGADDKKKKKKKKREKEGDNV